MQKLHHAIKSLVTHRKELSCHTGAVAKSAAILSTCEEHAGLSRALSQLADVEEKVELLRSEQANSDLYILSEILKDYLGLFVAIKHAFHERVKVLRRIRNASHDLADNLLITGLSISAGIPKLGALTAAIDEASREQGKARDRQPHRQNRFRAEGDRGVGGQGAALPTRIRRDLARDQEGDGALRDEARA